MFRVIVLIFINAFFLCGLYGEISSEANAVLKEIDNKNNEYHSGTRLVRTSEAKDILNRVNNSNLSEEEKMHLSIECYTLWANVSIASGTFEEDYKTLGDIYNNLKKDKVFKKGSSDIYAAFANFANSFTSLAFFNKKYPYSVIVDMYTYSRLALLKDKNNIKAKQVYGMWQIATLGFYNNAAFYSVISSLNDTSNLPDYMVYRAYIYRSMAYMKVNETAKAFKELDEALKMYPKGFYGYLLKGSYDKGKDGFLSAEGADF
ncbi:hypothetical protein SZ51_02505 [Brachyspira hyodysenteriae]|uniref:hypothetical protein n=1 Tax=Brachyspira hyodysenteriae TaxID=159 RepID=UPI00063DA4E6|nr:hypothetical protein [Brachyspira hyodysenteriae]KLI39952.1 hypothetical protein SZ51_02505 [Brachyspira hyodysenteriae]